MSLYFTAKLCKFALHFASSQKNLTTKRQKMKRILLILFIAATSAINAQTYFSENFEGVTAPGLPAGWTATPVPTLQKQGWKTGTNLQSKYFPIPAHSIYMAVNDDTCNCNQANMLVYTPVFTLPVGSHPELFCDVSCFVMLM
jgi:hypothetical protein